MKKVLENIFLTIAIITIFWFAASYIEVISKNLSENPQYSFWNIFELLVNSKL